MFFYTGDFREFAEANIFQTSGFDQKVDFYFFLFLLEYLIAQVLCPDAHVLIGDCQGLMARF